MAHGVLCKIVQTRARKETTVKESRLASFRRVPKGLAKSDMFSIR